MTEQATGPGENALGLTSYPTDPGELARLAAERDLGVVMLGAGCFWGPELHFEATAGVVDTEVGYSGGHLADPDYRAVCSDATGHAEVVLVFFDPARIGFDALVRKFFEVHDPTQVDRQGVDIGSQYRSAIFCFDEGQLEAATAVRDEIDASGRRPRPIVTQIAMAEAFWAAEDYHQDYLRKRGRTSCGLG